MANGPGQPPFAILDRLAPDVFAVFLEQVERAEDRAGIGSVAADEIEHGQAAVVAEDRLAVDNAGFDGQLHDRGRPEREAIGEVVAIRSLGRMLRPRRCARCESRRA